MRTTAVIGLLCFSLAETVCAADGSVRKKQEWPIEGTWVEASREWKGKTTVGNSRLVLAGRDIRLESEGGDELGFLFRISIDESRSPSEITAEVIDTGRAQLGLRFPGRVLGIYNVDGDTLKICWGNSRPTKFESKGSSHYYSVFKRRPK
jgi:uncharacterized protein (TIGR03067 family)